MPLIKVLKRWNSSVERPIKPSFLIEVMTLDLSGPPFTTYPMEIRSFFASVLDVMTQGWLDFTNLGSPVSDRLT